jgi:AraC-like DNA-binding protein
MEGFYEKIADDLSKSLRFFRHKIESEEHGKREHVVVPHYHSAVEISFVAEGEYSARIGDTDIEMKAGDLVYVDSWKVHTYTARGKAVVYAIIFDGSFLAALGLKKKTFPLFMEKMDFLRPILDEVGRDCATHDELIEYLGAMGEDYKLGVLLSVLGGIMQKIKPIEKALGRSEELIVSVLRYIDERYAEEISLDGLAAKFGYAKNYFSKLFNQYVGLSLREYLNRKRIIHACEIIKKHADLPLCKIAEMVGYQSWNTFYRAYVKYANS